MKFSDRVTVHVSTLEKLGKESFVMPAEPAEGPEVRRRRNALDALSPMLREYVERECERRGVHPCPG